MRQKTILVRLLLIALPALVACGSKAEDVDAVDAVAADRAVEADGSITEAELPAGFPRHLIPPDYEEMEYTDFRHISGVEGASFTSFVPVSETIEYYIKLVGQPKIDVSGDAGQRNVQWHELPDTEWVLGVLGDDGESIVTVTRIHERD